jgi:beta-phosphoglucomutase-like phosphatase (HAD superfamily)
LAVRGIIFDLESLSPGDFDYKAAWDSLVQRFGSQQIGPRIGPMLGQLASIKKAHSGQREYDKFFEGLPSTLDEIELGQVKQFSLSSGAKNALLSLRTMKDIRVGVTSSAGRKALESFLDEKQIRSLVDALAARGEKEDDENGSGQIEYAADPAARLERLVKELSLDERPGEVIYFCTTIPNLKAAKSKNLKTVVLPSKKEKTDALMMQQPDGLLITLDELPAMLSLESFKGSSDAPTPPPAQQVEGRGTVGKGGVGNAKEGEKENPADLVTSESTMGNASSLSQ